MDLLTDLATSCNAALQALPTDDSYQVPDDGISLLDVKNEIFISYLQGLALRNLLVVRSIKEGKSFDEVQDINTELTKKLAEQRLYLERGVRPLEQRIKYQVDKVVKAANDEVEQAAKKEKFEITKQNGSEESEEDEELDELAYRPNPAAFAAAETGEDNAARRAKSKEDGVYRPPRVSATAMPNFDQKERRKRPDRSTTVDEYISNELSTAPVAQPSIGSTITGSGRGVKNARAMAEEAARREYEETHLVRLSRDLKKEKAQRARERGGFGGEEWRGIGENLDRITDLTRNKSKVSALDKSRKRRAVEDGPRNDGIGGAFDVKRKRLDKKLRR
ncbi:hypothetical protein AMS68_003731 [Peltaster fructicola]|uniref:Uncharacterized protein n=1 Tax=Peltaster fructicola TaxID=286661 RepID=A0A6H0XU06_9PEZI|nr:hypothetical protein AMS68_003731 [Peltaster fructicola]